MSYTASFVTTRIFLSVLALLVCGCSKIPDRYAPPIDRKPITEAWGDPLKQIADMNTPQADSYIVRDISPAIPKTPWRWTYKRPELRFILYNGVGRKFIMDLAVPEVTFKETGPVTISVFINDHPLDQARYDTPGQKHMEKPVPPEWLKGVMIVNVAAEIDKVWTQPQPGSPKLGFILFRAGFE